MIDRDHLKSLLAEGAQVLDVLPAAAYRKSHIRGARSMPLRDFSAKTLAALDKSKPTVVYCNDYT